MLGINDLWLFAISGLLLNMTPGADLIYLIDRSIHQGVRYGIAAGLGASLGCVVHICLAVLGLSAIMTSSELVFSVVKYLGAAYLAYLGLSLLLSKGVGNSASHLNLKSHGFLAVLLKAAIINILNPKVAVFFLAFFPQFVDTNSSNAALAFLFLGAIFVFNATLWNVIVAWSAGSLAGRFEPSSIIGGVLKKLTALVFIGLGVRLALSI